VNTGATDDLAALRRVADREGLWFHLDGAFGSRLFELLAPTAVNILRVAVTNHRSRRSDFDLFVREAKRIAGEMVAGGVPAPPPRACR
jgi:glutamate/tyrosine decarboxylase-like PLP-dependent enzyme